MHEQREHEVGLATFLTPDRRARFRKALERDRSRTKLQRELHHFEHRLDERFAELQEVHTKHDEHVAAVYERLVADGAPEQCFVIAAADRLDGRHPLRVALGALMREGSGFISCVPGTLAAYVGEDGASVFSVRRRPRAPRG